MRSNNYREAVTIPVRSWVRFRDVISDMIEKVDASRDDAYPSVPQRSRQDSREPLRDPVRERDVMPASERDTAEQKRDSALLPATDRGAAGEPEADDK